MEAPARCPPRTLPRKRVRSMTSARRPIWRQRRMKYRVPPSRAGDAGSMTARARASVPSSTARISASPWVIVFIQANKMASPWCLSSRRMCTSAAARTASQRARQPIMARTPKSNWFDRIHSVEGSTTWPRSPPEGLSANRMSSRKRRAISPATFMPATCADLHLHGGSESPMVESDRRSCPRRGGSDCRDRDHCAHFEEGQEPRSRRASCITRLAAHHRNHRSCYGLGELLLRTH